MVEISPLIARRSRISASAFTGRSDPTVTEIDPQSKALLNSNSIQLGLVSRQVENLSARVNQLSSSLQAVRNNLATSQALERQKENQERILETKLAQQKLREGKESAIEKKITVAAFKPIRKLGAKAQSSLSGLSNIFTRLFGAFLAFKGVETIKALAEGNTEKLEEIKNQVLLTVGGFVGLSLAVKAATGGLSLGFLKVGALLAVLGGITFFREPAWNGFRNWLQENSTPSSPDGEGGPENPDPKIDYQNQNQDPAIEPSKSTPSEVKPSSESEAPNIDYEWWKNIITDSTPTSMKRRREEEKIQPPSKQKENEENKTDIQPNPTKPEIEGSNNTDESNLNDKGDNIEPQPKGPIPLDVIPFKDPQSEPKSQSKPQSSLLPTSREQEFRKKTAERESRPENQVGAKVTDPEILKMIEEEREIGRTGKMPTDIVPIYKDKKDIIKNVSQSTDNQSINVVPMPIPMDSGGGQQQVNVSSGSIAKGPGVSIPSSNSDNPYILGALAQYNVLA